MANSEFESFFNNLKKKTKNFPKLKMSGISTETAVPHSYPWQALITISFNEEVKVCSGTLIESQWIVTAAHCVVEYDSIIITRQR